MSIYEFVDSNNYPLREKSDRGNVKLRVQYSDSIDVNDTKIYQASQTASCS